MNKITVENFNGPLDLLLQLIEDRKLEITKVSLVEVTEQYLATLKSASAELEKMPPGELAEFLAVASRLLLIKSKALLPYLIWDEDDDTADLERQLKIYKEYAEAASGLLRIINKKHFSYSRDKLVTVQDVGFQPPKSLSGAKLASTFMKIISGIEPAAADLPQRTIRKTVSIQEKIQQLRDTIWQKASVRFSEFLSMAKDRTEVIVSFLAVLELVKGRQVTVAQDQLFEDILVKKVNSN
ncbi:hypothetical protein CL634_04645 [bacterium]|nr:hypothetical protein [bacterium]